MNVLVTNVNVGAVLDAVDARLKKAATIIGGMAESNAKKEIKRAVYDTPPSPTYVRTGNLRNSLTYKLEKNGLEILVGSNVEYAPYVELGTIHMGPRPYLRPAIEKYVKDYADVLREELSSL